MKRASASQSLKRGREKQTRYLSQALQLEEAVNPYIIRSTMIIVSFAIVGFFVWAGFTNINEVARTPGEVVPKGYQQTVQHLEGGIIKTIHVREGEFVNKGQTIVSLSDNSIRKDLERTDSKQLSLDMHAERLRAFAEGRDPDFSGFTKATDKMIADQLVFFTGMKTARDKEAKVIEDQIANRRQALTSIQADLTTARRNYGIINDIYGRREILNRQGYAPDIQLLETQRQLNDVNGQISRLQSQAAAARNEVEEFEARLESLSARHRDEAFEKLDLVMAERNQNIEIYQKLEERISRLEIKAPVDGLVKGLAVNTVGGVIQPGQTIAEIVPAGKNLEVQVKISPKDIGHLTPGQAVQVKFSTYDFSRYGSVPGSLDRISATTFSGENGERYYQGIVLLQSDHVGKDSANTVLPGMTVMADIITGEKTILEYLLRPIHLSLRTAFTER